MVGELFFTSCPLWGKCLPAHCCVQSPAEMQGSPPVQAPQRTWKSSHCLSLLSIISTKEASRLKERGGDPSVLTKYHTEHATANGRILQLTGEAAGVAGRERRSRDGRGLSRGGCSTKWLALDHYLKGVVGPILTLRVLNFSSLAAC